MPFGDFPEYLQKNNFQILNIAFPHLTALSAIENHHKDLFDRILIAQAITEDLTVIYSDQHFRPYPIKLAW